MRDFVFIGDSGTMLYYGAIPVVGIIGKSTTDRFEHQVMLEKFGWLNVNGDELHLNPAKLEAGEFDEMLADIEAQLDDD